MMFELTSKLDRPWNRPYARAHFVEHHAKRPEVGRASAMSPPKLLGSQVSNRPDDCPRSVRGATLSCLCGDEAELSSAHSLGETEIEHLDAVFGGDDHVRAFQVPIESTPRVWA
jgi:hypothetical protein